MKDRLSAKAQTVNVVKSEQLVQTLQQIQDKTEASLSHKAILLMFDLEADQGDNRR